MSVLRAGRGRGGWGGGVCVCVGGGGGWKFLVTEIFVFAKNIFLGS